MLDRFSRAVRNIRGGEQGQAKQNEENADDLQPMCFYMVHVMNSTVNS